MPEPETAEVVRRYFEAVERDPSETAALYSPDAVLHYSGTHRLSGDHHGPEAVLELFRRSREAFRGTQRLAVHDILGNERHAVALLDAAAQLEGSLVEWQRVVVFHVDHGRISEQWIVDGDQALVDRIVGR